LIIVDTSAFVDVLVDEEPRRGLAERMADDGDLQAPHLVDVEFVHALRRLVLERKITEARAEDGLVDFDSLSIRRYPHVQLRDRIWQLRANFSAYDAAFVALAEALEAPLVTIDKRLGRAASRLVAVETY
jgi:predicted nucleic acid-binding protein